jgi:predicted transcriptional regulator of viral defense system
LDVTTLERTLIYIAKRPAYAGGVVQILKAFRKARNKISIGGLIETLNSFNYIYPYHQAIGFYMERAGYSNSHTSKLMEMGISYDFYVDYQLKSDKNFDEKWRVYYPSILDTYAFVEPI